MRFIIVTEAIEYPVPRKGIQIRYEEAILNVNHIVSFTGSSGHLGNSKIQTTTGVLYALESREDLIQLIIK
jgi:hypothetical protein